MTDEEMAKEYVHSHTHYDVAKREDGTEYAKEVSGVTIKEAFLAGLEAGRPKWHKVADGDLPKNRRNVYVVYLNGYNEIEKTIASFRHKYWVFNGLKTECEVIAWSELLKFED